MVGDVYSYTATFDTGFAPHVSKGLLSLACCKPRIRQKIKVGDFLVAFYGVSQPRKKFAYALMYVARVTEVLTLKEYAASHTGRVDCVYDENLQQLKNPFHGSKHVKRDLSGVNVALSVDFVFFGDKNVRIAQKYECMIKKGPGHKVRENDKLRAQFPAVFRALKEEWGEGVLGKHLHMRRRRV